MHAVITSAEFDRSLSGMTKGGNLPAVYAEAYIYVAAQCLVHRNIDAASRMYAAVGEAPARPNGCTVRKFTDAIGVLTEGAVTFTGSKGAKVATMAKGSNLPDFDSDMSGRFWEVEKEDGSEKTPEQRLFTALEGYCKKQGIERMRMVVALYEQQAGMLDALACIGRAE